MTIQFFVAAVLFALAVAMTAGLWMHVFKRMRFRKIANFYRIGFLCFAAGLAAIVWIQVIGLIDPIVGQAILNGLTASFVVYILFAWGRLTLIGLRFDATYN